MSKCVIKKTLDGIAEAIKEAKPGSVELKVLEQYKEDLQKLAANRGIDLKSTTTLDNLPNRRSTKGDMNHTGGAYGADSIWANLLRPYGVVNVHYRPINDKPPKGVATLKNAGDKIVGITDEENSAGNALNTKIGNSATELNNRNLVQVYNADKVFAVAPIVNGKVTGGTGSAVRLAEHLNREVYVLNTEDVQWYKAKDGKYVKIDYVPKIEGNFAAVGTRKIEQYSTPVKDKNGNVLEWKKSELVSNYKEVINAMKAAVDASYSKQSDNTGKTINVHSTDTADGWDELSNFNAGPVTYSGKKFNSVENAFQYMKIKIAGKVDGKHRGVLTKDDILFNLVNVSANEARTLGRTFPIDTTLWTDKKAEEVLYDVMNTYYKTSDEGRKLLLSTGDAVITHKGKDGKEQDNGRFSRLLMKIRDELKAETKVKDGIMTTKEQQEASRLLAEAGLDATTIVASIKNDIEGCS